MDRDCPFGDGARVDLEVLAADGDELLQVEMPGGPFHVPSDRPERRVEPDAIDHPRPAVERFEQGLMVEGPEGAANLLVEEAIRGLQSGHATRHGERDAEVGGAPRHRLAETDASGGHAGDRRKAIEGPRQRLASPALGMDLAEPKKEPTGDATADDAISQRGIVNSRSCRRRRIPLDASVSELRGVCLPAWQHANGPPPPALRSPWRPACWPRRALAALGRERVGTVRSFFRDELLP